MKIFNINYFILTITLLFFVNGCAVSTVIGTAADVAIEVVKVPFKVGGAVVDAVEGAENEKNE